jgi:hypothetical protein
MRAGQELLQEEMLAEMESHHERIMAKMDSQLEKWRPVYEKQRPRIWWQIQRKWSL